jgi:competence protein ComEA
MPDVPFPPRWRLRRADQAVVATLVALACLLLPAWWFLHRRNESDLVEIDRADSLTAQFTVDINTADIPELMQLPRVGESLARRIVNSRKTDGPFLRYEDLARIRGIGPKMLENLRPYVCPLQNSEKWHNADATKKKSPLSPGED